jgi:hypothetical protein
MDLEATREFTRSGLELAEEKKKQAVIALHGRFKNEIGDKCHLMPLVPVTNSGLMPAKWMNQMLEWYMRRLGSHEDPFFVIEVD